MTTRLFPFGILAVVMVLLLPTVSGQTAGLQVNFNVQGTSASVLMTVCVQTQTQNGCLPVGTFLAGSTGCCLYDNQTLTLSVPATLSFNGTTFYFSNWEDGSTNPTRTYTVSTTAVSPLSLTATYSTAQYLPVLTVGVVGTIGAVAGVVVFTRVRKK